jgi:hypothetical protein
LGHAGETTKKQTPRQLKYLPVTASKSSRLVTRWAVRAVSCVE